MADFGREVLTIVRVFLQPDINGPVIEEVIIISTDPLLDSLAKLGHVSHVLMQRGETCESPCVKPGMKKAVPMVAIPCVGF